MSGSSRPLDVAIAGGGPAGLYFALLLQRQERRHRIRIYEKNPADMTFGWGVVFSQRTLELLREQDADSCARLMAEAEQWDNVDVVVQDQKISVHGNHFVGVERIALLHVLQRICLDLGVEIHFETRFELEEHGRGADLIVAADGVGSVLRDACSKELGTTLDARSNQYIWLGTPRLFHGLTLTFRPDAAGLFIAHSYKFSKQASTFIVECDNETFRRAELEQRSIPETLRYLEGVFKADLDGHPLLSNQSKWIQFLLVKNERWHTDRMVLLGDACHTAHFSIGSGTKLAMEDAIALAKAFEEHSEVRPSLEAYQRQRKPVVDEYQRAAFNSLRWFETAHERMHLDPIPFAFDLMTRSDRLHYESLRKRDPAFVAAYESYCARSKS